MSFTQSAIDAAVRKAIEATTAPYQQLIDLEAFSDQFVQDAVTSRSKTTEEENCYLIAFYRAAPNIRSIIALNHVGHFQAVAMLARNLFELAVESRMTEAVPDGWIRIMAFQKLEKVKAARNAIKFEATHGLRVPVNLDPQKQLVATQGAAIDGIAKSLFGSTQVSHWSGKNLCERCETLGGMFEEYYKLLYKQLSWHVHPGLAGALDMQAEIFAYLFGISCQIAAFGFEEVLRVTIKKFDIATTVPTIEAELIFAKIRGSAPASGFSEAYLRKELGLS